LVIKSNDLTTSNDVDCIDSIFYTLNQIEKYGKKYKMIAENLIT